MGIWATKWLMWKEKVDLNQISTPRKLFFSTKPTETQIMYLDMVEERNAIGWCILGGMTFVLGILLGWLLYWAIMVKGC
jgi:hypothetical protein